MRRRSISSIYGSESTSRCWPSRSFRRWTWILPRGRRWSPRIWRRARSTGNQSPSAWTATETRRRGDETGATASASAESSLINSLSVGGVSGPSTLWEVGGKLAGSVPVDPVLSVTSTDGDIGAVVGSGSAMTGGGDTVQRGSVSQASGAATSGAGIPCRWTGHLDNWRWRRSARARGKASWHRSQITCFGMVYSKKHTVMQLNS